MGPPRYLNAGSTFSVINLTGAITCSLGICQVANGRPGAVTVGMVAFNWSGWGGPIAGGKG